jgi:putative ABC transport system substrate-binding protein
MIIGTRHQATGNSKKLTLVACVFCALLFGLCVSAEAQQPIRIPRIGFLSSVSPSTIATRTEAFRQGLRELGYVDGKNVNIEWRSAEGKPEHVNELAAKLVRLKPDVIVTTAPAVTASVKQATKTIPIVMAFDDDPVGNKFVASLARPGGNITGLSNLSPEISGKQLELLREIVPGLTRVAVLGISDRPGNAQTRREIEVAAGALGVTVQYLEVKNYNDIETAFRSARNGRAQAVLCLGGPVINSHRTKLVALAAKSRLPAMYPRLEFVEVGGLMTYSANITHLYHRAAVYVDKILKGAKPAELPVEQPTKFELLINLNAAKQIGLTIPPNVLARADRVIR